jgi:hemerythrin-like metal-binding protein
MQLIEWRDEFATGITSVDHEHWTLIRLLNDLYDRIDEDDRAATSDFLGRLYGEIAADFALEERVMRDYRYAGYSAHKADHERLLDELRDIMEAHERGGAALDELPVILHRWFVRHFQTTDTYLHRSMGDVATH